MSGKAVRTKQRDEFQLCCETKQPEIKIMADKMEKISLGAVSQLIIVEILQAEPAIGAGV